MISLSLTNAEPIKLSYRKQVARQ